MKLILRVAFRNIFRQRGRSVLLGLSIGIGMMVLVMTSSFTKGFTQNALRRTIDANIFGHLGLYMVEKEQDTIRWIIRDTERMSAIVQANLDNVREVREFIETRAFAVGNGQSTVMWIAGVPKSLAGISENFKLISGNLDNFANSDIEHPFILEQHRADVLNVKVGDIVRVRMNTIYGQVQTARLNLVGIIKVINPFMEVWFQGYLPINHLKALRGYQTHETQHLNIVLDDVDNLEAVVGYADQFHRALGPEPIAIDGSLRHGEKEEAGILVGFQPSDLSTGDYETHIKVLEGDLQAFSAGNGNALIERSLAEKMDLTPGMNMMFAYKPKYGQNSVDIDLHIAAIIEPLNENTHMVFVNGKTFYSAYLNDLPEEIYTYKNNNILSKHSPLFPAISSSWTLADRTYSDVNRDQKYRKIEQTAFDGRILDISSIQEVSPNLVNLRSIINIISFFAILIVFSIILVGVLNTVRMNIKERTREIGTVRAVGMQRKSVIRTIITEAGLLSLFAALSGAIASFALMDLISLMTFKPDMYSLATLLDNGHIKFIPSLKVILIDMIIISIVVMAAAYFPARKAARMSVANALGHYE